ncbi:MAG: hypothetical protein A2017_20435 [Lentisphaerae bacterium GWF2_44_16]|nr:MAG: hypothetical protein A2017_20435 [Lentisphaerae bacterium GWF2_44_16]
MYDITILCYGTLMRKQSNHRFCKRAVKIESAIVCGKLYQLPPGFPALQVPDKAVLWTGSKDVFADAQEQYNQNSEKDFEFKIHEGWSVVHGELVTFADPESSVPPIDKLEGRPFFYDRVLVPAKREDGSIIAAWAYTMDKIPFGASPLPNGIWPENRKVKPIKINQN